MTWLGLPWGPITSWEAASRCFITLAGMISLLAALRLYLLLRIGVKPLLLIVASACVLRLTLGPYPTILPHNACEVAIEVHACATAFLGGFPSRVDDLGGAAAYTV